MPFPIVSCSYHHLDLQSFGLVVKFYVTDLTLTSIVALIRPEDESGIGAGLWTLAAARLIEFTDSEREREQRHRASETITKLQPVTAHNRQVLLVVTSYFIHI